MKLNLLLTAIASVLTTSLVSAQGFYNPQGCGNLRLLTPSKRLEAKCRKNGQSDWITRVLDLNPLISNNGGRLEFTAVDRGWFAPTCRGCLIEEGSAWLGCECLNLNQVYVSARLDLNNWFYHKADEGTFCYTVGRCGTSP